MKLAKPGAPNQLKLGIELDISPDDIDVMNVKYTDRVEATFRLLTVSKVTAVKCRLSSK